MGKIHDSSALAKRVSDKLKLNQEEGLRLYKELSQLPNGSVKDALDALLADEASTKPSMAQYVACIKGSCVRDAQYAKQDDADLLDEDAWTDASSMPLFLEIIASDTPTRAKQIAAVHAGMDESVVELYPVNEGM